MASAIATGWASGWLAAARARVGEASKPTTWWPEAALAAADVDGAPARSGDEAQELRQVEVPEVVVEDR